MAVRLGGRPTRRRAHQPGGPAADRRLRGAGQRLRVAHKAQFSLVYDAAKIPDPPTTLAGVLD